MQEEWRIIPGYNGYYSVSTYGNIKRNKRIKNKGKKLLEDILLKQKTSSTGNYSTVNLWDGNKYTTKKVHRIVSEVFIPNPNNKPYVNHKDCNKNNNRVENLEWCTPKENTLHSYKLGRIFKFKLLVGEDTPNSSVTNKQVEEIFLLIKNGFKDEYISKKYFISKSVVNNIRNGWSWNSVTKLPKRSASK